MDCVKNLEPREIQEKEKKKLWNNYESKNDASSSNEITLEEFTVLVPEGHVSNPSIMSRFCYKSNMVSQHIRTFGNTNPVINIWTDVCVLFTDAVFMYIHVRVQFFLRQTRPVRAGGWGRDVQLVLRGPGGFPCYK